MLLILIALAFFGPFVLVTVWARRIVGRYERFVAQNIGKYRLTFDEAVGRSPLTVHSEQRALQRIADLRVESGEFGAEAIRLQAAARRTTPFSIIGLFSGFPAAFLVTWVVQSTGAQAGVAQDRVAALFLALVFGAFSVLSAWQVGGYMQRRGWNAKAAPMLASAAFLLVFTLVMLLYAAGVAR